VRCSDASAILSAERGGTLRTLAFRVAGAQGFAEGNKRTALLLSRWVLDHNGLDGLALVPPDDRKLAHLLIKAAAGAEVESEIVGLIVSRT
jgi:prophage maintenance system killer protein